MATKKTTKKATSSASVKPGTEEKTVLANPSAKEVEMRRELAKKEGTTERKINDKIKLKVIRH